MAPVSHFANTCGNAEDFLYVARRRGQAARGPAPCIESPMMVDCLRAAAVGVWYQLWSPYDF